MTRNEAGRTMLRQLAERYPYFLPLKAIHLLLKEETTAVRELSHIYGVNPVVLHYLPHRLREQPAPTEKKQGPKSKAQELKNTERAQPEAVEVVPPEVVAGKTPETVAETAPETPVETGLEATEKQAEAVIEKTPEAAVVEEETLAGTAPEVAVEETPEALVGKETLVAEPEGLKPTPEKAPEIIGWQLAETSVSEEKTPPKTAALPAVEDTVVVPEAATGKGEMPLAKAPEEMPEAALETPAKTHTSAPEKPAENGTQETVIQPLYTKDYFKHQGVSFGENEGIFELKKPSGNDLMVMRSFAEWLRFFHSKKAKAVEEQQDKSALRAMWQKGKLAAALEEEGEEIPEVVFEMAVKSISHEGNPTTETMARIYLGQGKWEKAIAVYEQLQLRNPQKSAYFAEKIAAIEQQHRP